MAVDVIRYSGDLKLATAQGGTITLDTGVTTGTVIITGNLNILGKQTNISFTNTNIQDNILLLNAGETNSFVSYGSAGFAIDRGSRDSTTSSARLLYTESTWTHVKYNNSTEIKTGIWTLTVGDGVSQKSSALRVSSILLDSSGVVDSSSSTQRMILLGQSNPSQQMLSVAGQNNYASRVTDDDDIPNKYYVDNTPLRGTATTAITALELKKFDTRITITDGGESPLDPPGLITTVIDGVTTMIVQRQAGVPTITLGSLIVAGNTLRTAAIDTNLILQTSGTGTTVVNNGITVGVSTAVPQPALGAVKIYTTSTVGAGSTGIRYAGYENNNTLVPTSGELISARKALVLSIIF
jgi:hypothetical protein